MTEVKVCFLGVPAVGKTAIINRLTKDTFGETGPSLSLDLIKHKIEKENQKINITFWDCPGDIRFRSTFSFNYKTADIIFLVFSLTEKESFDEIDQAYVQISDYAPEHCRWILIGNKADLQKEREVEPESVRQQSERMKAFNYLELSAKTGVGMSDLFDSLYRAVFDDQNQKTDRPVNTVDISQKNSIQTQNKKKCCS
jgi:small GTP-binding protein